MVNDPKYTFKYANVWFKTIKFIVFEQTSPSLNQNPVEYLKNDVRDDMYSKKILKQAPVLWRK